MREGVGAWKMKWMLFKEWGEKWEAGRARHKLEGFMVLLGATLLTFIVHVWIEATPKKEKSFLTWLPTHAPPIKTPITAYLYVAGRSPLRKIDSWDWMAFKKLNNASRLQDAVPLVVFIVQWIWLCIICRTLQKCHLYCPHSLSLHSSIASAIMLPSTRWMRWISLELLKSHLLPRLKAQISKCMSAFGWKEW